MIFQLAFSIFFILLLFFFFFVVVFFFIINIFFFFFFCGGGGGGYVPLYCYEIEQLAPYNCLMGSKQTVPAKQRKIGALLGSFKTTAKCIK